MFILSAITTRAARLFHHGLREIAYSDMARQASGWIPEQLRIESQARTSKPIDLDFGIPKKHRLNWIQRTIHHLPH